MFNKWESSDIEYHTNLNEMAYRDLKKKLQNFEKDDSKSTRLKINLCKTCSYIKNDRMCFQAFTNSNCKICGKEMIFPNSDVDKLCLNCAKEHNLCTKCGAKMD